MGGEWTGYLVLGDNRVLRLAGGVLWIHWVDQDLCIGS